jgi:hypothetical protein
MFAYFLDDWVSRWAGIPFLQEAVKHLEKQFPMKAMKKSNEMRSRFVET